MADETKPTPEADQASDQPQPTGEAPSSEASPTPEDEATQTPAPEAPDADADAGAETETGEDEERLDQNVSIEEAGPARKKITIEVPAARIADKLSENLQQLQEEAVLPGFRRGRAPMRLIEKRFGSDVRTEVKNQVLSESFSQVVEDEELRIIGEPDIKNMDELELPEDGDFQFEVEVEVTPEFELPDLEGLEIRKKPTEVTDEQVTAEIDRYCEMQGELKAVDGEAEAGDYLTADVEVRNEAGEVVDTVSQATIRVPDPKGQTQGRGAVAGIIIEDLGPQAIGRTAGDTLTLETTGPKQHENEALREKPVTLEVRISRVERMTPAQVSDILAALGMETEDELRDQIKANLGQRAEAEQQQDMHRQVHEAILEKVDFELPQDLSERQTQRIQQRRAIDMMYRGASQQDIEEQMAELRSASAEEAQRELKLFFVLNKYAEAEDVQVSEHEVNGRLAMMALQQGRRPEKFREELARSGRLEQLHIQLREQKVIDKILEHANITEAQPGESTDDKASEDAS